MQPLSEQIMVRVTETTRRQLEQITANSITRNVSDHVRAAINEYIERNLPPHEFQTSPEAAPLPRS